MWIVHIKQLLEALRDLLDVGFAGLRRFDVQDATGLLEAEAAGREGVGGGCVALGGGSGVFRCGRGLFIGLGECTAEDTSAGEDNLGDDTMGLRDVRESQI